MDTLQLPIKDTYVYPVDRNNVTKIFFNKDIFQNYKVKNDEPETNVLL